MELTEITKFPIDSETTVHFGINRASDSNLFALITRQTVHVISLGYSYHFDGVLNYSLSSVDRPPLLVPSKLLDKDSSNVFNESTHSQKLTMLTDPNLMSAELNVNVQMITFISTQWSLPFGPKSDHYLMCLTNLGGCEIFSENKIQRNWNNLISNVGKSWVQHAKPSGNEKLRTIEALEGAVDKIRLTACCWSKFPIEDKFQFVTISKSGCIAFQQINPSNERSVKPQIIYEHDLKIPKTNALEWITFRTKKNQLKSFVICGDSLGNVSLHHLRIDNSGTINGLTKSQPLFDENDGVIVNGIIWEYLEQRSELLITFCKGMHIFIFILSDDGHIKATGLQHVGHLTITGISRLDSGEYLVTTLDGHMKHLRIEFNVPQSKNNVTVSSSDVKSPINHSLYISYGLATSMQNGFVLMPTFANAPFDHLVLRKPVSISICQYLGVDCLQKLQNISTKKLTHCQDLAELVRCLAFKNPNTFQDYLKTNSGDLITDELLDLKIKLIVASALDCRAKKKQLGNEKTVWSNDCDMLKNCILVINCIKILSRLSQRKISLSEFQLKVCQCIRSFLNEFLEKDLQGHLEAVKLSIHPHVELVLTESEHLQRKMNILCIYCDKPFVNGKIVCDHQLPRCIFSTLQLPFMNQRHCVKCQVAALDGYKLLSEIIEIEDGEGVLCPFCDSRMSDCAME